jgi:hypothetical protein
MKKIFASLIIITFISQIIHAGQISWDVDENNKADALTDALLIMRSLFGLEGSNITSGAVSEDSPLTESEIISSISSTMTILDIDNDGRIDALTDGLMLMRYLFGLSGENLIESAISDGAMRNSYQDITAYITNHMPENISSDEDGDGSENQSDQDVVAFQYKQEAEKLTVNHFHAKPWPLSRDINYVSPMSKNRSVGMEYLYDENNFVKNKISFLLPSNILEKYNIGQSWPDFYAGNNKIVTLKTSHGSDSGRSCDSSSITSHDNPSLLFLQVDKSSEKIFYHEYSLPNTTYFPSDSYPVRSRCFEILAFDGFFVALRLVVPFDSSTPSPPFEQLSSVAIEAIKIDFNGVLLESKVIVTHNFQSTYNSNLTTELYTHYDDIIIRSYDHYYVLDSTEFSFREPFGMKVNGLEFFPRFWHSSIWGTYNEGQPFRGFGHYNSDLQDLSHLEEKFRFKSGEYSFELDSDYNGGTYTAWNVYDNGDYASEVYSNILNGNLAKEALFTDHSSGIATTYNGISGPELYKVKRDMDYYADFEFNFGYLDDDLMQSYNLLTDHFPKSMYIYAGENLPLNLSEKNEGVPLLYLDQNGQHPGCTKPISINPETVQVVEREEPVEIIKYPIPDESHLNVNVSSGEADIILTPYEYRAPVLCSDYKVNMDQIFSLQNSETRPFISPRLHSAYERTLFEQPENGTYDVVQNTYTPDLGFEGKDMFKILIDDNTGDTQIVTIDVDVY